MSLRPLNATMSLGEFDGLDTEYLTLKGGEVVTLKAVVNTAATDEAAADVFDGYTDNSSVQARPAVTKTLVAGSRPLMLADDGINGYGTLFGTVVGGIAGQVSFGPNSTVPSADLLGPHTAAGSGKVTCWAQPGLYAVSLDAVSQGATGLQPTNTSLNVGSALTYTSAGLLTPVAGGGGVSLAPTVATLVEFATNGSLVTTPNSLVAALNSPSGSPSSFSGLKSFQYAVIWFAPPIG